MSASRKKLKLNVLTFALMLREFQSGPTSSKDIVEITGYQRHTVTNYLRVLHDKGCIHIVGYEEDAFGRQRAPVYALGAGKDVPRRPPLAYSITNARWRERQKFREMQERLAA